MNKARADAIEDARALLAASPVIVDSETTGLGGDAQICELAVITADGAVALDQRIKPTVPIPEEVAAVHGITDADVADMPGFREAVAGEAELLLENPQLTLAIYNAPYDLRLIDQSYGPGERKPKYSRRPNVICVMDIYSRFHGEFNERYGSYTWQSLAKAAEQCGLSFSGPSHSALADARMTLDILRTIAETGPEDESEQA